MVLDIVQGNAKPQIDKGLLTALVGDLGDHILTIEGVTVVLLKTKDDTWPQHRHSPCPCIDTAATNELFGADFGNARGFSVTCHMFIGQIDIAKTLFRDIGHTNHRPGRFFPVIAAHNDTPRKWCLRKRKGSDHLITLFAFET